MEIVLMALSILAVLFGFVVFFGAPYLPTTKNQVNSALALLALKPGQRLLELGAGDGTVTVAALRKGLKVTAIELNPVLCAVIFLRTIRYRRDVTIRCGNFWHINWGEFDGVYVFLLDKYMKKLDNKLMHNRFRGNLASFAFRIPGLQHVNARDGVYLYDYATRPKKSYDI